jgi:DNA invertase Pin-like site-specific DNA recombinase
MSTKNGKALRFAALVRVSTERQEEQGESLRTQRGQNQRDVERLGGRLAAWYGGQEHGTAGWERKEVDRLIADASRGKFDAVIVANADRWSRDNAKSRDGLEAFREAGVRFFVGSTEYDLFNPEHCLFLGMSAVIGEFQARHQSKKSVENRIERAKRGLPACGTLPFGRTWDGNEWHVDPEKQAMVEDVAARYLNGESLPKLAKEYGVNASNLHRTLTERCGPVWEQHFHSKALNIKETVRTKVPELLPWKTIIAVLNKADENKARKTGRPSATHALSKCVFCSYCGHTLLAAVNKNGGQYYRHVRTAGEGCVRHGRKMMVRKDDLDEAVFRRLFELFGNPRAVRKAVEAAVPNRGEVEKLLERQRALAEEVAKVGRSRNAILDRIERELITGEQADAKLVELKEREAGLREELDGLAEKLADVPDVADIDVSATRYFAVCRAGRWENFTRKDKLALAALVFSGGSNRKGKRPGVYVEWSDGKKHGRTRPWDFKISGRLVSEDGRTPRVPEMDEEETVAPLQKRLVEDASSSLPS